MAGTVNANDVLKARYPLTALASVDSNAPAYRASYLRVMLGVTEGLTYRQRLTALSLIHFCLMRSKPLPTFNGLMRCIGHKEYAYGGT